MPSGSDNITKSNDNTFQEQALEEIDNFYILPFLDKVAFLLETKGETRKRFNSRN